MSCTTVISLWFYFEKSLKAPQLMLKINAYNLSGVKSYVAILTEGLWWPIALCVAMGNWYALHLHCVALKRLIPLPRICFLAILAIDKLAAIFCLKFNHKCSIFSGKFNFKKNKLFFIVAFSKKASWKSECIHLNSDFFVY